MANPGTLQDKSHGAADGSSDKPQFQPATRGPEHWRLEGFVGRWITEGQAYDGPFGPSAKITAVETYEWLPGGLFLVHRMQGRLGDQEMACLEVIGHEASRESYAVRSFYNDGTHNLWLARERDGTWTFAGEWKKEGKPLKVRCTAVFKDAGNTLTGDSEYSEDGSRWQRFWETKLTRA
jgi:hypothetical protein